MSTGKVVGIVGTFAVVAVACFLAGQWTAPEPSWEDQHINESSRTEEEFANSFLGLTVRVPTEGDWWLLWKPRPPGDDEWEPPEFKMPSPANANKVLEIERQLDRGGSDRQWARMDVFVEPLYGRGQVNQVLRRLQFRQSRRNLRLEPTQSVVIGGKQGSARKGKWSVAGRPFRVVMYWVEHEGKLYVFSGVTPGDAFSRFLPAFNQIIESVELD
jgi:hypothetical protein